MPIKENEAYRMSNGLDQKRKYPQIISTKTLNTESNNNKRILKAEKEKEQGTQKGRPIRITPVFSTETFKDCCHR